MTNGPLAPQSSSPDPLGVPAPEASDRELLDRFHRFRDQCAFEALVRRHGPMVLGVCRRVLSHAHDAEDAFQATFMVLVRRAGSVRDPELLANFLYGVAYRVARKARTRVTRRSQLERQAKPMPAEDVYHDLVWQELRSVLDQELQTLPVKYQAPLVLCYLEGLSNEEAARRLGWPSGSISYRLAKGREMLRQRLAGREQAFSADAFAVVLSTQAAATELPDALLQATLAAALTAAVPPAVVGGNLILRAFRALAQDNRSTVVLLLMLLLSLGLATSVVARGFIDSGGQSNSGNTAVSPTSRPCH